METNVFYKMMSNYNSISEMFKTYSYCEIVTTVSKVLNLEINALESLSMGGYTKGKRSGAYQFVIEDLIKNIKHYS